MIKTATDSDAHAQNTHDGHVVQGHPDVLAVVQRGHLHLPGLPRQEGSEQLIEFKSKNKIKDTR